MNTGAKIAIGCGIAVVVAGGAVVVGVVGLGFWAKGKVEELAGNEQRLQELQRKANANAFTAPADGIIQEERLVKFIDVRRRIFDVYVTHKDEIEALSKKKEGSVSDLTQGLGILNEARMAQAQALADVGMSQSEYSYLVSEVYLSMWASEWQKGNDGKTFSQSASEAAEASARSLEEGAKTAEATADASEADQQLTPEQREAMRRGAQHLKPASEETRRQAGDVVDAARKMDSTPENVALFRKYETDIKKYAMGGLEWMGL